MLEKSFCWLWRSVARGLKRCLTSLTSSDRTSHFKTTNLRRGQSLALLMECCARFNWKAEQALLTSLTFQTSSEPTLPSGWLIKLKFLHILHLCVEWDLGILGNSSQFSEDLTLCNLHGKFYGIFHSCSILSHCIVVWYLGLGFGLGTQTTVVCVALLWRSNAALQLCTFFGGFTEKLLRFCSTLSDCIGVTVKSAALCGGAAEGGETVAWK